MSRTFGFLLFLYIFFLAENSQAQRLGKLPYKTDWQELKHDSLSIIFPKGYEASAQRIATLMLKLASVDPITKEGRYKPISVILQPYTNDSKGVVGLAPYAAEMMLQPEENPFKSGTLPWSDFLAIHEYRQVQQINAVNTGISHLIKAVFGEKAFLAMYGLAVSNWLREGDAIVMETKWTPQGRGRLNRFLLPFREKNSNDEFWRYYVLRNGSFKQNVPDHLPLGYLMTQYGNEVFGEATWDTIFRLTPRMNPIYDPFSGVVKKFYGKSNRFLYEDALKFYGPQGKLKEVPELEYPMIPITEKENRNAFFDMSYPSVGNDGTIYTAITSFDSIGTIFKFTPDGKRTKVVAQGIQYTSYLDYNNHHLVWTEKRVDPRWSRRDKNVIVVYNLEKKTRKNIKPSKGYFMPSLDAAAEKIVALHTDPEGKNTLHILNAVSGKLIQELPNYENLYLGYPSFDENNLNIIASARNHEGQMCLLEQNIETGTIRQITPYSSAVLGRHDQSGQWIFLTCGMGDSDQVYAVDRNQGHFYQVSGGNKAHYDPAWDPLNGNLVCTEYTNNGSKLVRLPGLPDQWKSIDLEEKINTKYTPPERNLLTEPMSESPFEVKKYSPWKNAINYYGLDIIADDPFYGIELLSENILNTVSLSGGYSYNRNNKAGGPFFDVSLSMWYPVINLGYKNTTRKPVSIDSFHLRYILDEVYAGISLPLYFSPGVYQQMIQFSSQLSIGNRKLKIIDDDLQNISTVYYGKQSLLFLNSRKKAYRQPFPSWAQRIAISYAHEVTGSNIRQWFASADFAIPGISASNYTLINSNMLLQDNGLNSVQLGSDYVGPRGFQVQDGGKNYKLGLTYGFPIAYPDIGFGNILYVPRIRLQTFFDVAYSDSFEAVSNHMSSTGAELLIDFYLGTFTLGLRYARLLTGFVGNPNKFEIFIPSQRF